MRSACDLCGGPGAIVVAITVQTPDGLVVVCFCGECVREGKPYETDTIDDLMDRAAEYAEVLTGVGSGGTKNAEAGA